MIYTDSSTQLLWLDFQEWALDRNVIATAEMFEQLATAVHERFGWTPPKSAWDVVASELNVKLKKQAQPIEVDDAFRSEVQQLSSSELLKRINTDAMFKARFDALAAESAAPQHSPDADDYSTFTASDWHAIPQSTLARLMTKPSFRKRVEQLAAQGAL